MILCTESATTYLLYKYRMKTNCLVAGTCGRAHQVAVKSRHTGIVAAWSKSDWRQTIICFRRPIHEFHWSILWWHAKASKWAKMIFVCIVLMSNLFKKLLAMIPPCHITTRARCHACAMFQWTYHGSGSMPQSTMIPQVSLNAYIQCERKYGGIALSVLLIAC